MKKTLSGKMQCLGECQQLHIFLCAESGKCPDCCDNECGCGFKEIADDVRFDNLCETRWLRQQAVN
jgi:hypothetical protein